MYFKLDINHIWVFFCIEDSDTTEHLVSIYFCVQFLKYRNSFCKSLMSGLTLTHTHHNFFNLQYLGII